MFKQSAGVALVIDGRGEEGFKGNYASSYKRVINFLARLVTKYHDYTLFFFIEDNENPGFTNELISKVTDDIDVISISEGAGNKEEAINYFIDLISKSRFRDLADKDYLKYLPEKRKVFKCTDVQQAFNKWQKEVLRTKAYSAYSKCNVVKQKEERKNDCYKDLKNMVGLTEIKGIVDKIIASYKVQQYRDRYGFSNANIAKHMVFTGNPGSAKTTVARLLADILTKEGILTSGGIVECGRGDLVGKYVGWTARIVMDKFKAASGGILFIDEAYALVEEDGLYGDEAINTIVQEMENHRDDVIVIFAGYPDKMEKFLEKNEGLRSRIAFHLNFPDYTGEELLEIMKLMLEDKGFITDKAAEEKCLAMFKQACAIKDFGNGRFVRNVIERAMLNQAERLVNQKSKTITKNQIRKIMADDFDESMVTALKQKKDSVIGFAI
ncbi:MAG: AAA family ATPase [Solobacterium sp.]|nr:AAA family ATPase [Solobacterium sp.]